MMFYGADLENEVRLINVSEGGLAISTSVPRKVEGNVAFRFQLPETKTLIVVRGRVAWSKDQSQFGIEFAPPVNLSRQQLNDWLTRRTYDPPKPAREAMAAASPAPVKSPEIVFLPSLLKPSHPLPKVVEVPPLEVLPLAGFQAATTSRVPPLAGFQLPPAACRRELLRVSGFNPRKCHWHQKSKKIFSSLLCRGGAFSRRMDGSDPSATSPIRGQLPIRDEDSGCSRCGKSAHKGAGKQACGGKSNTRHCCGKSGASAGNQARGEKCNTRHRRGCCSN